MSTEQHLDRLHCINKLPGFVFLVGYMNINFDNPLQSQTKQNLTTHSLCSAVQVINEPMHRCGYIIVWVVIRPDNDIHKKSTVTYSLQSDHYCTKSYFIVSAYNPSTTCRAVSNMAIIDCPSLTVELSCVSVFSSVEKAHQCCDFLRTDLDKHAPLSLRKVNITSPLHGLSQQEMNILRS